jgi:altronate hydrolase
MPLVEILSPPTPENAAIRIHPSDNVAIARLTLPESQRVVCGERTVVTRQSIPAGHKLAIAPIPEGAPVIRYGQPIGAARTAIEPGVWVHSHNLRFTGGRDAYEFPEGEILLPQPPKDVPTFEGYLREDGRAGTRNYIAVVAASNCAAHAAELIAASYAGARLPENVDGIVAFPHGEGCGMAAGPDLDQLQRTLAGVLHHPNVSSAVILGLGCEVNQISHYLGDHASSSNGRLVGLTLQASGGTMAAVEAARASIGTMIARAAAERRTPCPASKIVLALNCGGSDAFSGITANPALGVCCDHLAALGATVVLAETTEIFGAEHLLVKRARNRAVAEKLLSFVEQYKQYLRQFPGSSFDDNPSPGNKEGGLTNIVEKSLGAIAKAGSSPLMDAVAYAAPVRSPGFVFMNTPGYDPVSLTGLAAGGANLIAFTTGRGSAIGFPTIPVIKIASNSATYNRMRDNMDVNAGRIASGDATVEQIGREIFDLVLRTASGARTSSERLGHKEFVPWRIGPVM